jgi:cation diffusion facilitator CzcD-associated flavoprotein CzcO
MTRIAIVGAGCAGLQSAALFVNKFQCQVVIFEQRTSVGYLSADHIANASGLSPCPVGFVGFPVPEELLPDNRTEGLSRVVAQQYTELFIEKVGLRSKIRLSTRVQCIDQISPSKVELSLEDCGTGNTYKETFDYVMNTGYGHSAVPATPRYPGADTFAGQVLSSRQVTAAALEHLRQVGEPVVVVGGSRAALHVLILLRDKGIPVHWVAERTHWFVNADTALSPSRESATAAQRLSATASRLYRTVSGSMTRRSNPDISIKSLSHKRLLVNAHPPAVVDEASAAFQFEVIDEHILGASRQVPFTQGQFVCLTASGVAIASHSDTNRENSSEHSWDQQEIKCGTVIVAQADGGCGGEVHLPEFRRDGDLVDVTSAEHIYQMSIHPGLPRVYFHWPLMSSEGLAMLNAYHSTQHAIVLWSKQLAGEEMHVRAAREADSVSSRFTGGHADCPFVKPFDRRKAFDGNAMQHLAIVDGLYRREGYTSRLSSVGLAQFVWNCFTRKRVDGPYCRDPTATEVRVALETSAVAGHGLVPISEALLPVESRKVLPERMSATIDKNAVVVPLL